MVDNPQATFPCAMLSAGCTIEITEQVVSGKVWTCLHSYLPSDVVVVEFKS